MTVVRQCPAPMTSGTGERIAAAGQEIREQPERSGGR
jgi:hypothetical protein